MTFRVCICGSRLGAWLWSCGSWRFLSDSTLRSLRSASLWWSSTWPDSNWPPSRHVSLKLLCCPVSRAELNISVTVYLCNSLLRCLLTTERQCKGRIVATIWYTKKGFGAVGDLVWSTSLFWVPFNAFVSVSKQCLKLWHWHCWSGNRKSILPVDRPHLWQSTTEIVFQTSGGRQNQRLTMFYQT